MILKRMFAVSLMLAVLPLPAHAITVRGFGAQLCKTWTEARSRPEFSELAKLHQQWAMGYLSALGVSKGAELLRNSSNEAIYKEIDRLCGLKDQELIADVLSEIADELGK